MPKKDIDKKDMAASIRAAFGRLIEIAKDKSNSSDTEDNINQIQNHRTIKFREPNSKIVAKQSFYFGKANLSNSTFKSNVKVNEANESSGDGNSLNQ